MVSYIPQKKNAVVLLSTWNVSKEICIMHHDKAIDEESSKKKQVVIQNYNDTKGV